MAELDIPGWVRKLMDGAGGYKAFHRKEVRIGNPTIYKAVEFTIRALGNVRCEDGDRILEAIIDQRVRNGDKRFSYEPKK